MDITHAYIPMDRRQSMLHNTILADHTEGAGLFADISGFTKLTRALVHELGPQRGAEELTYYLNLVYDALICTLHSYGGSVIAFAGDAITCWFDESYVHSIGSIHGQQVEAPARATACAIAMQQVMAQFSQIELPANSQVSDTRNASGKLTSNKKNGTYKTKQPLNGSHISLAMKASVAAGSARRFMVGNPQSRLIDALAGQTLFNLAEADHQARKGEVILDPRTLNRLNGVVQVGDVRVLDGKSFGVVKQITKDIDPMPWPTMLTEPFTDNQIRPWLLPSVYTRLKSGQGEFLAELRPSVAVFVRFDGIDYDSDDQAGAKLDAYIRWVLQVVNQYEGSLIDLNIGDKGSCIYISFGAPIAHEDDAVRAAATALEIVQPPQEFDFLLPVRIGISQGRMRAGAYGGQQRRTYGVLGNEVNMAARIMQSTPPGHIMVSKQIRDALASRFTLETVPAIRVKGRSTPLPVFRLRSEIPKDETSYESPQINPSAVLPMVGRRAEQSLIIKRLNLSLEGQGQVVAVVGEAGIGKSRLVTEIIKLIHQHKLSFYGGKCESFGVNSSYMIWKGVWRRFFGLSAAQSTEQQLMTLEERLRAIDPELLPRMPLLSSVVNLPIPENQLTEAMDAKVRKTSLEAMLLDFLRNESRQQPFILILEDCQWLDALSADLLSEVSRMVTDYPIFIMMIHRPLELQQTWVLNLQSLPHFTDIQLKDLSIQDTHDLIQLKMQQLFGGDVDLSQAVLERITEHTAGNPFYIEELLNYLHFSGLDKSAFESLDTVELPTTLHSLILSRIDQLMERQKVTLKVASVVGRIFAANWLWGGYPEIGAPVQVLEDLEKLTELNLTARNPTGPTLSYMFKHMITKDVTYESMPYGVRATLHEKFGRFIEKKYQNQLVNHVDILAYHYGRSDNLEKKRYYLRWAGEMAQARYANSAALMYYRNALPLLPEMDQIEVLRQLGAVLQLVGEWHEAKDMYVQAMDLAEELVDQVEPVQLKLAQGELARASMAFGELLRKQGEYQESQQRLHYAQDIFDEIGDQYGVGQALHNEGTLAAQQGSYDESIRLYEASLAIRQSLGEQNHIGSLLSNMGIVARFQADYQTAQERHERSLEIRRDIGDPWAIANSLNNLGNVMLDIGDYNTARRHAEEAVSLQREIGDRWALANALNNLGNVTRTLGEIDEAYTLYNESLRINYDLGAQWAIAYLLEDIGCLAALRDPPAPKRVLYLYGAAQALRKKIGSPLSPAEETKLLNLIESSMDLLDDQQLEEYLHFGLSLSLDEAVLLGLENQVGSDATR
ncbi:MAG: tetratricopeptide repeat protein [Chloroflexota bacterium]